MASPFERLAASLDYPLYIVTAEEAGEPTGCLVGFATQCSIHPPRFLVCISKKNHTLALARRAAVLGVHVVEENVRGLAEIFGGTTGDEIDKFAGVRWHLADRVPILEDCRRWFAGRVMDRIDFGDHVGFLLEPIDTAQEATSEQLTFQQARDIAPGHEP